MKPSFRRVAVSFTLPIALSAFQTSASTYAPNPVLSSGLVIQAVEVPTPYSRNANYNIASPKPVHGTLHFIDQRSGKVQIVDEADPSGFRTVLDLSVAAPNGFTLKEGQYPMDLAAGPDGKVYISATSTTLPDEEIPQKWLPDSGGYEGSGYQLVYSYDLGSEGELTNPSLLASFEVGVDHNGGALLGLPDGSVLFATGDGVIFGLDGRSAPQNDASHLSKIFRINATSGAVDLLAKGIRNVQRMTFTDSSKTHIAFADIGGVTAEEINIVSLDDLLDTDEVENFGWGRNSDGKAREGTFYVGPGQERQRGQPGAVGFAPLGEEGFIQPYAQYGREELPFAVVSGPVFSEISLSSIAMLFGDLRWGSLFATRSSLDQTDVDVYEVSLLDEFGLPTTLLELADTTRADARFFNFDDGSAGVLLESSGRAFALTEVTSVPGPATGGLLVTCLAGSILSARSRRRGDAARN